MAKQQTTSIYSKREKVKGRASKKASKNKSSKKYSKPYAGQGR